MSGYQGAWGPEEPPHWRDVVAVANDILAIANATISRRLAAMAWDGTIEAKRADLLRELALAKNTLQRLGEQCNGAVDGIERLVKRLEGMGG